MDSAADIAASLTDIPKGVILAQWALESAWGTSDLAKRANNFSGIKSSSKGKDFVSGAYAGYNTKESFARDYARVMKLSYYDKVREAESVEDTINEFGKSPYAEDPNYAAKLRETFSKIGNVDLGAAVGEITGSINFFGWAIGAFIVWFLWWR